MSTTASFEGAEDAGDRNRAGLQSGSNVKFRDDVTCKNTPWGHLFLKQVGFWVLFSLCLRLWVRGVVSKTLKHKRLRRLQLSSRLSRHWWLKLSYVVSYFCEHNGWEQLFSQHFLLMWARQKTHCSPLCVSVNADSSTASSFSLTSHMTALLHQ